MSQNPDRYNNEQINEVNKETFTFKYIMGAR